MSDSRGTSLVSHQPLASLEELIYSLISHFHVSNGRHHLYSSTLGFFSLRFQDISCKTLVGS